MNDKLQHILENALADVRSSEHLPLLNTKYLVGLESPGAPSVGTDELLETLGDYPTFKKIVVTDLTNLRRLVQTDSSLEPVKNWCLKLLRYVEINYASLKTKEKESGRRSIDSMILFNHVRALFVEYYLAEKDILYLNTALKISDLPWITPKSNASEGIKALFYIKNEQIAAILSTFEHA